MDTVDEEKTPPLYIIVFLKKIERKYTHMRTGYTHVDWFRHLHVNLLAMVVFLSNSG